MRRERGEMSRGQIIQISIIGVAIVVAGVLFYRNLTKSGYDESLGEMWECKNCGHVFYVEPSELDEQLKAGEIMLGEGSHWCLRCPECKEQAAFRAYKCPECGKYYNQSDEVNGRTACRHCGYDAEAAAEAEGGQEPPED